MFFVLFFISLVTAQTVCTYDDTRSSADFQLEDNYHERYCDHTCPCLNANDCVIDLTAAGFRETENVNGTVDTLITRDYDLTFTLRIPVGESFVANKLVYKSNRMLYKLAENSTLTVKDEEVDLDLEGSYTTIVRCNTKCEITDSVFKKRYNESISFMPEMSGEEEFIKSYLTIRNAKFYVQSNSDHFSHNYGRDQLEIVLEKPTFVVEDYNEEMKHIPLFFSRNFSFSDVQVVNEKGEAIKNVEVKRACGENWLVAYFTQGEEYTKCDDPTVALGDADCEKNSEIAFIVIACCADLALVILIIVFLILILVPIIKKKKKYEQI